MAKNTTVDRVPKFIELLEAEPSSGIDGFTELYDFLDSITVEELKRFEAALNRRDNAEACRLSATAIGSGAPVVSPLVWQTLWHIFITLKKKQALEFWNQFREYAREQHTTLRVPKASRQPHMVIDIGYSDAHLSLRLSTREGGWKFVVALYIPNNKKLYEQLLARKRDIKRDLGETLLWLPPATTPLLGEPGSFAQSLQEDQRPPSARKAGAIMVARGGDMDETSRWENHAEWLLRKAEKFQSVFSEYLKEAEAVRSPVAASELCEPSLGTRVHERRGGTSIRTGKHDAH